MDVSQQKGCACSVMLDTSTMPPRVEVFTVAGPARRLSRIGI